MDINKFVGVVVIGRNEGDRLVRCINSLIYATKKIVYVDSGSTDGSVDFAMNSGIDVVNLDLHTDFTAARARNAGFKRLLSLYTEVEFVQFIDGDCQIVNGWLGKSTSFLINNPRTAIVCGRRREQYPDKSIYNLLCDIEWDTPIGEAKYCGGDFMARVAAISDVNGFNSSLIAGEEPELCIRIRGKGWKIFRIQDEMTIHDADITKFNQWWKRNVRAGHAFLEVACLHFKKTETDWPLVSIKIWIWGFFIPFCIVLLGIVNPIFYLGLLVYPIQIVRLAFKFREFHKRNWIYALFISLGRFPELQGQIKYLYTKLSKSTATLIEYK